MLRELAIKDLAIISQLKLDFKAGMTVFTGETGAGKSILIDALGLILGDRADSQIIRADAEQSEVSAVFDIQDNTDIQTVLEELSIEGDELLIRRVISKDGRSRAYINDSTVTIQTLRRCGEYLFDIHGQHAHHSLMKKEQQRFLLDEFLDSPELLEHVYSVYKDWQQKRKQLDDLRGSSEDHEAQLSLLRYQFEELEMLAPKDNEYEELTLEHKRLSNSQELMSATQQVYTQLNDSDMALVSQLSSLSIKLTELVEIDPELQDVVDLILQANIQLDEGSTQLRDYLSRLNLDPERLQELDNRLETLHDCARKHRVKPQGLPNLLEEIGNSLSSLEANSSSVESLQTKLEQQFEEYQTLASKLSSKRKQAAKELASKVKEKMHLLGMANGEFIIEVENNNEQTPSRYGNDDINFLVSTNPGVAPRALGKVASGGELSRISLAIQIIASNDKGVASMVFDEVDTGIGGSVAEIVGQLLSDLAKNKQVFCVTHLAQVASFAQNHLWVSKQQDKKKTETSVSELNKEQRVDEIARMIGGVNISKESLAYAKEMLASKA